MELSSSKQLRSLIERLNETQHSFAKKIGVSQSRISMIINRDSIIGGDLILKIMTAFPNVDPVWLLSGEGDMFKENYIAGRDNNVVHGNNSGVIGNNGTIGNVGNNNINQTVKGDSNITSIGGNEELSKLKAKIQEMEQEIDSLKKDKCILQEFITFLQKGK